MKFVFEYTAIEPVSHGGEEVYSTVTPLRKIRVLANMEGEQFEIEDVPVISGNSIRGKWRRAGAKKLLELLGLDKGSIGPKAYHILFSGGALEKGTEQLDIGFKKRVRRLLPLISVFGAGMNNFLIEGRLTVGFLFPLVKELSMYTGIETDLSFYDVIDTIFYTRRDDYEHAEEAVVEEDTTQMKYEIEVFIPGTKFRQIVFLHGDNEIEHGAFANAVKAWLEHPYIGGAHRVGHGKVDFKIVEGELPADEPYIEYVKEHRDEIVELLASLG